VLLLPVPEHTTQVVAVVLLSAHPTPVQVVQVVVVQEAPLKV
jgi:hypothetical protein